MRFWLALHPDLARPIGGVKQMHRLCECINEVGYEATLIQDDQSFHPGWFESNVPTISRDRWILLRDSGDLCPSRDVLIVPETFLPVIDSYAVFLPVVVFNQNGSYSFGMPHSKSQWKPDAVIKRYHDRRIVHVMCVSQYDKNLLVNGFGLPASKVSCVRNGLEVDLCYPSPKKQLSIAFMSRKNSLDVSIVKALLQRQPWIKHWQLVEIVSQPHDKVIRILRKSAVFLSFGHPEGFGLPVAESMACGCAVVGYSGLGGRELFDLGRRYGTVGEVAFGDWHGFVSASEAFHQHLTQSPSEFALRLLKASNVIRRLYSNKKMLLSVRHALSQIVLAASEPPFSSSQLLNRDS